MSGSDGTIASAISAADRLRWSSETVRATVEVIASRIGKRKPRIAVVLGSGWHPVTDRLTDTGSVAYEALPAFPDVGVAGHAGLLTFGRLGGTDVLLLSGRQHTYEDGRADAMKGAVRSLAAFGVTTLVLTNAAGSLDPAMAPGSLMLISDHLNMPQRSPLLGDAGGKRFVDLRDAYDPTLRQLARRGDSTLLEGIYAWVLGPQFETPAEIRMLRMLGADAVGMSTVPETILARHAGMRVLALSLITNFAAGIDAGHSAERLSHEQTLAAAAAASERTARFLERLIPAIP